MNALANTDNAVVNTQGKSPCNLIPIKTLAGAAGTTTVLTASDAGSLIVIPALAGACGITLPDCADCAGSVFRFVASDTLGNDLTLTSPHADIFGTSLDRAGIAGIVEATSGAGTATMVLGATMVKGDFAELFSDGDFWLAKSMSRAAGHSITYA